MEELKWFKEIENDMLQELSEENLNLWLETAIQTTNDKLKEYNISIKADVLTSKKFEGIIALVIVGVDPDDCDTYEIIAPANTVVFNLTQIFNRIVDEARDNKGWEAMFEDLNSLMTQRGTLGGVTFNIFG